MNSKETDDLLTSKDVLLGIFALLLESRRERTQDIEQPRRVELPLHEVGLDYKQIAALVNNTPGAVRKAISRGS